MVELALFAALVWVDLVWVDLVLVELVLEWMALESEEMVVGSELEAVLCSLAAACTAQTHIYS